LNEIIPKNSTQRIEKTDDIQPGQWYWIKPELDDSEKEKWFGCVIKVGSNYAELHSPHGSRGYSTIRIHFDNFWERTEFEPNPESIIQDNIKFYQSEVNRCLAEVREIVKRLGVADKDLIVDESSHSENALVVMNGTSNIKKYQADLIRAKEHDLPDLFSQIKRNSEHLTTWMTATVLPLETTIDKYERSIGSINDRIFNVSLYAGLTEEVVKCCDGKPAEFNEKLKVMQRRLYMDEECLLNYRHGGMEFKNIGEFDQWISLQENRERILPFPRCLVAMRVRREVKERGFDGKLLTAYINMGLEQADKFTFLYIRNGEQLYRLSCELDFGAMIFPDKNFYDPSRAMMVQRYGHKISQMITVTDYEERCKQYKENKIKEKEWEKQNPKEHYFRNPFRDHGFSPDDWHPFDQSNVYFDDCMADIAKDVKAYNRIAMIIQGLLDRSPVLHPHPPAKTWTPEGFNAAIELVYDGANTLYGGNKPDFEKYRKECNLSLNSQSIVIGQEFAWLKREAVKENNKRRSWRDRNHCDYKIYQPYGDPGPGYISKIHEWKARARKAIFRWERDRVSFYSRNDYWKDSPIPCSISVSAENLFNVSAYKLGDYKQFFLDPRTRAEYLRWAPMLLAAEEYCFENRKTRKLNRTKKED